MNRLPWIGAAAVALVIAWCSGGAYREGSIKRAHADSVSRVARDQGVAVIVQTKFTEAASFKVDSFTWKSEQRQAAHQTERQREEAVADSFSRAKDVLAMTLPALLDTRDSLRVTRLMLRDAEQEAAHLRAAMDRSDRRYVELRIERDSVHADRLRWKVLAMDGHAAIVAMQAAWDLERKSYRCYLIDIGPIEVGCPPRVVIAAFSFAAGGYIGYRLAK